MRGLQLRAGMLGGELTPKFDTLRFAINSPSRVARLEERTEKTCVHSCSDRGASFSLSFKNHDIQKTSTRVANLSPSCRTSENLLLEVFYRRSNRETSPSSVNMRYMFDMPVVYACAIRRPQRMHIVLRRYVTLLVPLHRSHHTASDAPTA